MKSTIKLIIAAFAAGATLISCTRDIITPEVVGDKPSQQSEGSRVITVSFAPQTKTDFSTSEDGKIAPYFVKGDKIVLCSDIESPTDDNTEICTVTEQCTITTKLTGELTAYYPADFVTESSKHGLFIYVPSVQDGTFANANICSATIAENATSANFENLYALFTITPPAGTKKLTIKSLGQIGEDGQRSAEKSVISATGDDYTKIMVGDGTKVIPSPCYVAMIGGSVKLSNLSFEATSDAEGTTGFIKGIPTSAIAAAAGTDVVVGSEAYNTCNTVAEGSAYTINNSNWHPYVTVAGRKWATMNIGAESETAAGEYFMWGEVVGHKLINEEWTNFPSENPDVSRYGATWNGEKKFAGCNAPFISSATQTYESWGCEYSKYNTTDNKSVLELCDDAANANWGGAWRMPTGTEFSGMLSNTSTTAADIESQVLIIKGTNLKFPGAGSYWEPTQKDMGYVVYWTSSLDDEEYAKRLYAQEYAYVANVGNALRWHGHPIRAIIDDPDVIEDTPAVAIPGKFSVNADGGQVMFSSGNLTYNVTSKKWSFYANQYDCATEYDANLLSYFNWGYNATQSIIPNAEYSDNVNRSSGNLSQGEDWGSQIGDGNTWHTPTQAEWKYILETRTNAAEKVGYAKVGTVCGIVILPDDFTLPSSCTFNPKATTGWEANTYTTGDSGTWKDMEEAGAVFLPAAGNLSSAAIGQWGEYGRYWSSSVSDYVSSSSYYLMFHSTGIDCTEYSQKLYSYSVRLIKDCTQAQKKK